MAGILDGIKIVDWTMYQVGPFATAMLADLGADVIHVEERGRGDLLRSIKGSTGQTTEREGRHIHFEEHNRNKRGITVDLTKPEGREIIYRLVQQSDVFATNMRIQAAKKLGMTREIIRQHNPRIIYALATGFGIRGPDVNMPSVDNIGLARSGMMMASGFEGDPPTPISVGTGDRTTSFMLAYGILGALLARERFGIAQDVDTSMLGGLLVLHGWTVIKPLLTGQEYARRSRLSTGGALYNCYLCKDQRWVTISVMNDGSWPELCQLLGKPEMATDPRFAEATARAQHTEELVTILEKAFAQKTAEEWHELIRQKGRSVMFAIANKPGELKDDVQVIANNYIVDWDHPVWGPIKFVGSPVEWSKTPATIRTPAPDYGQHTEEVLLELGYTWEDISRLQDLEVI